MQRTACIAAGIHDFDGSGDNPGWGWDNFASRQEVLDETKGYLRKGAIRLRVDIEIVG